MDFFFEQENCIDCFLAPIVAVANSSDILIPDSSVCSFPFVFYTWCSEISRVYVCVCQILRCQTFPGPRCCEKQKEEVHCLWGSSGNRSPCGQWTCKQQAFPSPPREASMPVATSYGFFIHQLYSGWRSSESSCVRAWGARGACILSIVSWGLNISYVLVDEIVFPDKPPFPQAPGFEPRALSILCQHSAVELHP